MCAWGSLGKRTFRDALQVVAAEGEAQRLVWLAVELGIVSGGLALHPIHQLQCQHLAPGRGGHQVSLTNPGKLYCLKEFDCLQCFI